MKNNFTVQPPKMESTKVEKIELKKPVLKLSLTKPQDKLKPTIGNKVSIKLSRPKVSEDMDVDREIGENHTPVQAPVDKALKLTFKKPKIEVQETKNPESETPIKLKLNFKPLTQ